MTATLTSSQEANGAVLDGVDWPYRFAWLPVKYLMIDIYQRPLTRIAKKVEKKFLPELALPLCVSMRTETKYAVIDGQNRAEGMKKRGIVEVPCCIYEGLSVPREAALFSLFQTERVGMGAINLFNARVVSNDPAAVEMNEIIAGHGLKIGPTAGQRNVITAIGACEFVYNGSKVGLKAKQTRDPQALSRVLETIIASWESLPETAKSAMMLKGLGYFFANQGREADDEKLAFKLSKVSPSVLIDRARDLRKGDAVVTTSSANYMARAIEGQYRKQVRR